MVWLFLLLLWVVVSLGLVAFWCFLCYQRRKNNMLRDAHLYLTWYLRGSTCNEYGLEKIKHLVDTIRRDLDIP